MSSTPQPRRLARLDDEARSNRASPLQTALTVIAAGYGLLFLAAVVTQAPVRLVDYRRYLGIDFEDLWTAAGDALTGRDPYLRPRFVTPPLSWIPFAPLTLLDRPTATLAFVGLDLAAVGLGLLGLIRRFGLSRPSSALLCLVCVLSPSTLMLIERGNLDGLVFLALCGFFVAGPEGVAGPVLLALAAGLKLYPAVFALALPAQGRIRAALLCGAALAAAALAMPGQHLAFLANQLDRAAGMRIDENISALAPFWLLDRMLVPQEARGVAAHPALLSGALLYAAALVACLRADWRLTGRLGRPDRALLLASYASFCVGVPPLVYLYSGLCLLVLLAAMGQEGLKAAPDRLRGMALSLGLVMVPAKSLSLTIGAGWAEATNLVPPVASLLLIAGTVLLRVDLGRASRAGDRAGGALDAGPEAGAR